jgi:MarR family transcriptional regulator for hemolysin
MHEFIGRQIGRTGKVSQAWFDARLAEQGGSLITWIVLNSSDHRPSQRELADRMYIEAPTLVAHLDRLERDGLVERRRDPDDRRVVRVSITPAGSELRERLRVVAEKCDVELRSLLSDHEQRVLERTLTRLHAHFSSTAAERKSGGT